jgi:hypothetical protein
MMDYRPQWYEKEMQQFGIEWPDTIPTEPGDLVSTERESPVSAFGVLDSSVGRAIMAAGAGCSIALIVVLLSYLK